MINGFGNLVVSVVIPRRALRILSSIGTAILILPFIISFQMNVVLCSNLPLIQIELRPHRMMAAEIVVLFSFGSINMLLVGQWGGCKKTKSVIIKSKKLSFLIFYFFSKENSMNSLLCSRKGISTFQGLKNGRSWKRKGIKVGGQTLDETNFKLTIQYQIIAPFALLFADLFSLNLYIWKV